VYRTAIIKPETVVMRAESFPRDEEREITKETISPMQPETI
jgi:hypothetical protein